MLDMLNAHINIDHIHHGLSFSHFHLLQLFTERLHVGKPCIIPILDLRIIGHCFVPKTSNHLLY
jgi:hypothetical protein